MVGDDKTRVPFFNLGAGHRQGLLLILSQRRATVDVDHLDGLRLAGFAAAADHKGREDQAEAGASPEPT